MNWSNIFNIAHHFGEQNIWRWFTDIVTNIYKWIIAANKKGLAIIARPDTEITKIQTNLKPITFEHLCCRFCASTTSFIVFAMHRLGSLHPTDVFFNGFTTSLSQLYGVLDGVLKHTSRATKCTQLTATKLAHRSVQEAATGHQTNQWSWQYSWIWSTMHTALYKLSQ